MIQIAPSRITSDLLKPQPKPSLNVRLRSLKSRVLTRTKLENLITEFDLYQEMRRREVMEDVIGLMDRDIEVSPTGEDTFQVVYQAENRIAAMRVAQRLAQIFINESYIDRQVVTEGTVQFLDSEVEEFRSRLAHWDEMSRKLRSSWPRQFVIENEVVEETYRTLNRELLAAHMAAAINRSELGERFVLLEPARPPEAAIRPSPLPFLAWGAFGGIVLPLLAHIVWVRRRTRGVRVLLYALLAIVLLVAALFGYLYWW